MHISHNLFEDGTFNYADSGAPLENLLKIYYFIDIVRELGVLVKMVEWHLLLKNKNKRTKNTLSNYHSGRNKIVAPGELGSRPNSTITVRHLVILVLKAVSL